MKCSKYKIYDTDNSPLESIGKITSNDDVIMDFEINDKTKEVSLKTDHFMQEGQDVFEITVKTPIGSLIEDKNKGSLLVLNYKKSNISESTYSMNKKETSSFTISPEVPIDFEEALSLKEKEAHNFHNDVIKKFENDSFNQSSLNAVVISKNNFNKLEKTGKITSIEDKVIIDNKEQSDLNIYKNNNLVIIAENKKNSNGLKNIEKTLKNISNNKENNLKI